VYEPQFIVKETIDLVGKEYFSSLKTIFFPEKSEKLKV
jgi:hypothetical protein